MASPLLSRGRKHRYSIPAQSSQILPKRRPRVLGRRPLYPSVTRATTDSGITATTCSCGLFEAEASDLEREDHTSQGLLEQHQQADGSVFIPDVLRPYMSGIERISAAAKGL